MTRHPEPWLRDRTVIVTGGASGIGRALATAMARRGASVLVADLGVDAPAATAVEIAAGSGRPVDSAPLDVRDRGAFAALVDRFVDHHGRIDVLVNCAGVSIGGATHHLTGAHWDLALDTNLGGTVNGVLAAYPHMVEAGRGHVVNIASGVGLAPSPFVAAYAASKHGVVGLSLSLRPEAALHGVDVSVVCPGAVDTPILDRRPPSDLPPLAGTTVTAREYLRVVGQRPVPVERIVRATLHGVRRNRAVIVAPRTTHFLWLVQRASPGSFQRVLRTVARRVDRELIRP